MSLPNYWKFPGGKVEKGENHQQALVREIEEELGVEITVGEKITDTVHQYEEIKVHLHTYYCQLISGIPVAKEHKSLEWVTLDNLHMLKWAPADIPTVANIAKGK